MTAALDVLEPLSFRVAAHYDMDPVIDSDHPSIPVVMVSELGVRTNYLLVAIGENTATLQNPADHHDRRLGRLTQVYIQQGTAIEWRERAKHHRNYKATFANGGSKKPGSLGALIESEEEAKRKRESAASIGRADGGRPDSAARGRLAGKAVQATQRGEGPDPKDRAAWNEESDKLREKGLKRCRICRKVKPRADFKGTYCPPCQSDYMRGHRIPASLGGAPRAKSQKANLEPKRSPQPLRPFDSSQDQAQSPSIVEQLVSLRTERDQLRAERNEAIFERDAAREEFAALEKAVAKAIA